MFPTTFWSGYGGKNGKAGSAGFGLLGRGRAGSSVCATKHGTNSAGVTAIEETHLCAKKRLYNPL